MQLAWKLGKWRFKFAVAHRMFQAQIPLQVKLTFYICTVVLVCMVVLSAVCIGRSLDSTQKLMSERLAHFAAIKAEQTERGLRNDANMLDTTLQGDRITNTLQSVYFGNITSHEWAANMNSMVSDMLATTLRRVQIVNFYDIRGNILFSSRNQDFTPEFAYELQPRLKELFPLGDSISPIAANTTGSTNITARNATSMVNQTVALGNSSQIESFAAQAAVSAAEIQYNKSMQTSLDQPLYKPPVNFTKLGNGLSGYMAPPVPLFNSTGDISAYSYSITTPMYHLQLLDSVQASMLIGYCTAVMDSSKYMNGTFTMDSSGSLSSDEGEYMISVTGITGGLWKYLFPTKTSELNRLHPMFKFPAVQADRDLWKKERSLNTVNKVGGTLMNTRSPEISQPASVGYSYVNAMGHEWFIMVSVPRAIVEQGYRRQTWKLLGVAASILGFVTLASLLVTGFIVNPVHHIYDGMELQSRPFHPTDGNQKLQRKRTSLQSKVSNITTVDKVKHIPSSPTTVKATHEMVEEVASVRSEDTTFTFNPSMISLQRRDEEEMHGDHEKTESFIPGKIAPLSRPLVDEFDELIEVYNCLVDRLVKQYTEMEDEVRLRTNEARKSQQLAEAANAAKSRFMMNVSHEFRTPMNAIMGLSAVSVEESTFDINKMRAGIRTIMNSCVILQELMSELLSYATGLSQTEELFQRFPLQELSKNISDSFTYRSRNQGVKFRVNINPSSLAECQIESDIDRINHICASFVSNAINFSNPNKLNEIIPYRKSAMDRSSACAMINSQVSVNIGIRALDDKVEPSNNIIAKNCGMLEIIVCDNGVGISKAKLRNIFKVFEHGEDVTSNQFNGWGLPMAKLLSESLGGYISISSCKYMGSIVALRVPVYIVDMSLIDTRPPQVSSLEKTCYKREIWTINSKDQELTKWNNSYRPHMGEHTHKLSTSSSSYSSTLASLKEVEGLEETRAKNAERFAQLRVLVVDDNDVLRELFKKMLNRIGVGFVDTASDGEGAIKLVEDAIVSGTRYRIMFMDLEMPKKNGVETTEEISRQLGYMCPVVALTGYSDMKTMKRCKDMGLSKVLVKPVAQKQLLEAILELVPE